MYFNDFELQTLNTYRIDDLRHLAMTIRPTTLRRPWLRIALAHALVAMANQIWREDATPTDPAPPKVALT